MKHKVTLTVDPNALFRHMSDCRDHMAEGRHLGLLIVGAALSGVAGMSERIPLKTAGIDIDIEKEEDDADT